MIMIIFDRVFDCNNMVIVFLVDKIYHRGQGSSFSAPGRTGDQDQTARFGEESFDGRVNQADGFQRKYF